MADYPDGRGNRPHFQLRRYDTMMTARRIAAAKYDLELIKKDVSQWLSEILQINITPQCFMESLDTGVALCKLVELIQEKAKAIYTEVGEESFSVKIPLEPIKYRPGVKKATFHARDNTKHFLDWCRALGIRDDIIFETNGLVEHTDEKRVLLCLLEVSCYAREVHIKPPDIISREEEVMEESGALQGEAEAISHITEDEQIANNTLPSDDIPQLTFELGTKREELMSTTHQPIEQRMSNHSVKLASSCDSARLQDGDAQIAHREKERAAGYSSLPHYCHHPFSLSIILLVLILGGTGLILLRRKK